MNKTFMKAARRSSLAQVRYVAPVRPGAAAPDLVTQVYAQVERDFGMLAPPIALHSPAPDVLAASWLMLRETLLATGLTERATKEAVGTAVSLGNACPYCVEIHSAALGGLVDDENGDVAAIADGRIESIVDPGVREIAAWARACGRRNTVADGDTAPFPPEQAPELIGVVVTFQYLNRMVNVFLRESPFPSSLPTAARTRLIRLLTRILGPVTRTVRQPGVSLDLLPAASLPADLVWASGSAGVAGAFGRAAAAVEAAGGRSVPEPVRELVTAMLAEWSGGSSGPSRAWVDERISDLAVADRPAGRLALLTTFASYQIGPSVIDQFRRDHPDDHTLIELTSWASLMAARQVGSWTWDALTGSPVTELQ